MPRAESMSYEGPPAYRWCKMYRGQRFKVTCEQLGAIVWTKEATVALANSWWRKKLEELEPGPEPAVRTLREIGETVPVAKLKEMVEQGQVARRILEQGPLDEAGRFEVDEIIGVGFIEDENRRSELLGQVVGKVKGGKVNKDRTVKVWVNKFLALKVGDSKPLTYRELRGYLLRLAVQLGENTDVSAIDEAKVEEVYLALKNGTYSSGRKKKLYGFFTRFVRYLWASKVVEMPRNLESFSFQVQTKAVKVYDLAEVRTLLASLTPRNRLYALLALNCGMTSVDIGQLSHDMIRGDKLTRRRVKTGDQATVPTITYPLWPETLALLEQCRSGHDTLVLTSKRGTPLWEARQNDDGTTSYKDLVADQWARDAPTITFKSFRSIGANTLESHKVYGRCSDWFLAHSPKSIKEKNYTAPPPELFDEAMVWLRKEVLGV